MDRRTLISAIALATVCARSGAFAQQQRSHQATEHATHIVLSR